MKLWIPSTCSVFCYVVSCYGLLGQQATERPAFEVASIKPAKPMQMGQMRVGMNSDAGMMRYSNVSLKDCIRTAYRVKDFQVQGPDWIGSTRFDIVAKLPAGSTKDQVPEMLQTLLSERFKLALHRETKDHAIYALVAGKGGPKLKPAEIQTGDSTAGGGNLPKGEVPRGAMMMRMDPSGAHLKAPSATLASLAEMISRFTERPVVDLTGIQGQYDFELTFAPETMHAMGGLPPPPDGMGPGPAGPAGGGERSMPGGPSDKPSDAPAEQAGTIAESVARYGLKLEPRKAPLEILIVDHIERAPTDN